MPYNNNVKERLDIIDRFLSDKTRKYVSIDFLMDVFASKDIEVSRRTVENDLNRLRKTYDAKIGYCSRNKGHYYEDENFSIRPLAIDAKEIAAILSSVAVLKKFSGIKLFEPYQSIIDKTLRVFDMVQHVGKPMDIIYFEPTPYNMGLQHFDSVYDACASKRAITIQYKKFGSDVTTHTVHPYNVYEYKDMWYLLCHSDERDKVIVLALDRVKKITPANVSYKKNKKFKVDEYFRHTIGVTLGEGPPQEIKLWFSIEQANYLRAKHLHRTQHIERDDECGMILTMLLIPNYELQQIILSYGPECEVLGPPSLRDQVMDKVLKTAQMYKLKVG